MNKEELIKLARDSYERGQSDLAEACKEASVKAIVLAVLAEREACAKVCEEAAALFGNSGHIGVCLTNAGAIRARSKT